MINPDLSTDERWPKGDSAGILRQVECFCRAEQIRMKITERNKNQSLIETLIATNLKSEK